jgi:hypothetical protein
VFPLINATTSNGSAKITLTVTPNTAAAPSLTTQPDVEVAFDDSDSSWFNVWTAQTGTGSTFKVTHSGATTTVRLGAYSVALRPRRSLGLLPWGRSASPGSWECAAGARSGLLCAGPSPGSARCPAGRHV